MQMEEFLFRLSLCPGLGPVSRYQLWQAAQQLENFTDLPAIARGLGWGDERIAKISEKWISSDLDDAVRINSTVPHISLLDERYPSRLKETYCPPLVLYYVGNWDITKYLTLAVVGSRRMTEYGRLAMNHLLPRVVHKKVATVSGLARGVDGMCHKLTICNYGRTIGVIGTGLDVYYPRIHARLQHQMAVEQLVITEYPLGAPALPHHFPERNRIIAGLCHSCLVIQAQQKSGSLITANLALQENRNVMAVPGPIDDPYSEGTNDLIAAGARPILHWRDILEELNLD